MDGMTMIIGVCLIWTGAVFFGYPIGWYIGKRNERRRFENYCRNGTEHIPGPTVVEMSRRRIDAADILNAEILEEVQK